MQTVSQENSLWYPLTPMLLCNCTGASDSAVLQLVRTFLNEEWERQLLVQGSTANCVGINRDFHKSSLLASRVPSVPLQRSQADSGSHLLTSFEYFVYSLQVAQTYLAMAAGKVALNTNASCTANLWVFRLYLLLTQVTVVSSGFI